MKFRLSVYFFLFLFLISGLSFKAQPDTLSFLDVSDVHTIFNLSIYQPDLAKSRSHYGNGVVPFQEFLKSIPQKTKSPFVTVTGDLIDFFEGEAMTGNMLGDQIEQFSNVEEHSPVPVYLTLGNHDITTNSWETVPKFRTRTRPDGPAPPGYGTYYSKIVQSGGTIYRLIFFDDSYNTVLSGEDMKIPYIDKVQLQQSADDVVIILMHIPLTQSVAKPGASYELYSVLEKYPHGFDLLAEAAKSAHKFGLEFYAVIKPFEGGGFSTVLPLTMPYPDEAPAFKDLRGIFPVARPFAAKNLQMNLKRKPGDFHESESVSAIRLIKNDNKPTRLKRENFTLWTSPTNNQFVQYLGPMVFRETLEKRYRFPYWHECRILHFENLEIPEEHNYFLIRCALAGANGDSGELEGSPLFSDHLLKFIKS